MDENMSASEERLAELERVFREHPDPAMTAPEVGDVLEISQQAAHQRLVAAHEAEVVERKTVGARSVVWWWPGYCDLR